MKKKVKMLSIIMAICLTACGLIVGVYAASTVTFSINGSVTYEAADVLAEFNTAIYTYTTTNSTNGLTRAEQLQEQGIDNITLPYAKDEKGDAYLYTYRTYEGQSTSTFGNIDLNFANCGTYFVVIEIRPLKFDQVGNTITATIENNTTGTNIWQVQTNNTMTFTTTTSQTVVIGMGITDSTQNVSLTLNISISLEELSEPKFATTFNNGGYTITGMGSVTDTDLVIDCSSYNDGVNGDYPIVSIATTAFSDANIAIVEILLSPQGTTIEEGAFAENESIQEITITGDGSIESAAFLACPNLTSVDINIFGTIGEEAFGGCEQLQTLNVNALIIYQSCFASCVGLTSITIGSLVQTIYPYVFDYIDFDLVSFIRFVNPNWGVSASEDPSAVSIQLDMSGNSSEIRENLEMYGDSFLHSIR